MAQDSLAAKLCSVKRRRYKGETKPSRKATQPRDGFFLGGRVEWDNGGEETIAMACGQIQKSRDSGAAKMTDPPFCFWKLLP